MVEIEEEMLKARAYIEAVDRPRTPRINRGLTKAMLKKYGWNLEKMVVLEEMAELTKEISKMERGKGDINCIYDELADVYIVLDIVKEHYNLSDRILQMFVDDKQARNKRRLEDGSTEGKEEEKE